MTELERDCLWTDYRPMNFLGTPIGRRCAVVRVSNGELVVFSPLEATPDAVATLRSLGRVSAFVVPSRFHDRFYPGYFTHFPEAAFLGNAAAMKDHSDWPLRDLSTNGDRLTGIRMLEIAGMPRLQEQVFLHDASKTLIVADAIFNVPTPDAWLPKLALRFAGIGREPGMCRLFRTMISDRKAFASSVETVLSWDFDRIVPGHGAVIERDAKAVLREAYRRYLT